MPKEPVESVGRVRKNRVAEISGCETVGDRIASPAQSGNEQLSMPRGDMEPYPSIAGTALAWTVVFFPLYLWVLIFAGGESCFS
jgi:hypothetical protein